jgi:arsenite-transporting ATPase
MRVVLFTGKGGVGKTTLAAATSARLAAAGRKVLVVSTDPAHSLGDAFGVPLSAEPVEVEEGLSAGNIDARGLVDEAWSELRGHLYRLLSGAGVNELDAEELTVLPGVEELLALAEVHRLAATGLWEVVLVDCGPTAETLRLLALPEALAGYLDRLFPSGRRGGLAGMALGSRMDGLSGTAEALGGLAERLASLRRMLVDSSVTSVRLVLTPERVVIAETRRTLTALALQGIRVDGVIANRVVPKPGMRRGPAERWMRTRRAEQDTVLDEVRANSEVAVRTVAHQAAEPVGTAALRELADDLYGSDDPLAENDVDSPPLLSVTGGGRATSAEYQLRIAVPLNEDAELDLARVDDDLAVTVDGRRKLIALPAVLRRCVVTGADVDTSGVVVHFRRQPTVRMR